MTDISALVKFHVLEVIGQFDNMNYNDPLVITGINAVVLVKLMDIQEKYPSFDGDATVEHDPEPVLKVTWWFNGFGHHTEEVRFRFNPARLDDKEDLYAAYDRAMSVL